MKPPTRGTSLTSYGSTVRPKSASRTRGKSAERMHNLSFDECSMSSRHRSASTHRSSARASQRGDHGPVSASLRPPLSTGRPVTQTLYSRPESRPPATSPLPTSYWRDLSSARGTATPHWKSVPRAQSKGERSPPTSISSRGNPPSMHQCSPPHSVKQHQTSIDGQSLRHESVTSASSRAGENNMSPAKWSSAIPIDFSTPYKKNANRCNDADGGSFHTPVAKSSRGWPSPGSYHVHSQERMDASCEAASGAKHFSIDDSFEENAHVIADDRSHQLSEVARSLETAAAALRNVVSPGFNVEETASVLTGISKSRLLQSPWLDRRGVDDAPHTVTQSKSSPSPHSATFLSMCQTRPSDETLSYANDDAPLGRLARENEALRGALNDAVRKLTELEGEKERFMSEDVFDLVNSLCRDSTGGAPDAEPPEVLTK